MGWLLGPLFGCASMDDAHAKAAHANKVLSFILDFLTCNSSARRRTGQYEYVLSAGRVDGIVGGGVYPPEILLDELAVLNGIVPV